MSRQEILERLTAVNTAEFWLENMLYEGPIYNWLVGPLGIDPEYARTMSDTLSTAKFYLTQIKHAANEQLDKD